MSAPLVAGGAALVRQYFLNGFYPSGKANASATYAPSGALLKAVLLGGAQHLDVCVYFERSVVVFVVVGGGGGFFVVVFVVFFVVCV